MDNVNFTRRYTPRPTTNKAKKIIRDEIKSFYADDPQSRPYGSDYLLNMREDAETYAGYRPANDYSDLRKGCMLVDAGNFRVYHSGQREFLRQIYGDAVDKWSDGRIYDVYRNLIGREYDQMLKERGLKR